MIRTLLAALLTLNPLLIDLVHAQQCNGQPPQNTTVTGTAMRTFPSGELKVYLEGGGWDFTAIAGFQQAAANWNAALQGNGFSAHFTFPGGPAPTEKTHGMVIVRWTPNCFKPNGDPCNGVTAPYAHPRTGFVAYSTVDLSEDALAGDYDHIVSTGAHELGHALGLKDSSGISSIMDGDYSSPNRIHTPGSCETGAVQENAKVSPPEMRRGGGDHGDWAHGGLCTGGGCFFTGGWSCKPGQFYDTGSGWCLNPKVDARYWESSSYSFDSAQDGDYYSGNWPVANVKPLIQITWPLNGATNVPRTGTIHVNVLDPDGRVWRVDWVPVDVQTGAWSSTYYPMEYHPFTIGYANAPPGWYKFVAVAYDDMNEYTISNYVTVYIP